MSNIDLAVNFALDQQGKPYANDAGRFGPNHYDCSGLVVTSLRHAGIAVPPGIDASPTLCQWGISSNTLIPIADAVHIRGALFIRGGITGWGANGHVCFSLGDGRTMEAMGAAYGCRIGNAIGRGWSHAFKVPTADYGNNIVVPPAHNGPSPQPLHPTLRIGSHGDAVKIVQTLLNNKIHSGLVVDGSFGSRTDNAVRQFQRNVGHFFNIQFEVDGIVGPATWYWLAA